MFNEARRLTLIGIGGSQLAHLDDDWKMRSMNLREAESGIADGKVVLGRGVVSAQGHAEAEPFILCS